MKYIPILYSSPMVLALLEDTKTMTRRTKGLAFINESESDWEYKGTDTLIEIETICHIMRNKTYGSSNAIICPYGQPGDVLWVRERVYPRYVKGGYQGFRMQYPKENPYRYYADDPGQSTHGNGWKPSIHMPKTACRIFLEVTDVRVERLQDISEEDAKEEGVERIKGFYKNYDGTSDFFDTAHFKWNDENRWISAAQSSFRTLWYSINGPASWEANHWVWVISFKKVERPKTF